MKCNQSRPGFELVSPCPFPTTITITPRAPRWDLMAELVLQISSLSFQYECSRIKLNIVCSRIWDAVEFILFFFSSRYSVCIPRWWKDTHLISDKTRINSYSFPRGQDFPLGIRLNETYHVSEYWFIQKISSFFSLRVLCVALFWNLGFFICYWFFAEQRQFLMCLHPSRNKRQLT